MATRKENTVTINHAPARVYEAFSQQAYWEHIAQNLSPEAGSVNSFTAENGIEAVLFEVLPMELIPEAVRGMISQSLKVKRVITYPALDGNSAEGKYTADVKGTPVDFEGTINLSGDDAFTTLAYNHKVTVAIPMMGAAIEPKVADELVKLYEREAELTEKWIAENL